MIHTIAARSRGYEVTSIATLLDEPPTGLLALESSGIRSFQDIVGKRIGYVGEFGKRMIDDLAALAGIDLHSYESVRVGMHVVEALTRGRVDAGIGFINFQQVELEALYGKVTMLRLDQLAGLGCCCFCSVQYIIPKRMLSEPKTLEGFLRATTVR